MNEVYVLVDEDKNIVTIYTDLNIAKVMKPALEKKLERKIEIMICPVNQDIKSIGNK